MRKLAMRWRRHPAPVQLSRYLDGELGADERRSLEDHLVRCARCRRVLESLAHTLRSLASLPRPRAPGLAEGIIAELRAADAFAQTPRAEVDAAHRGALGRLGSRASQALALNSWVRAARLRLTVPIALAVGVILSVVNQGGMLFSGQIDLRMCAICGLNFILPFVALNLALLAAARLSSRRR
jgi:anti-sigma factor RsiW